MQVRDEHRTDFDQGRGGYGKLMWEEIEARQNAAVGQMDIDVPQGGGMGYNTKRNRTQQDYSTYQAQNRNPRARDDDDD